MTNEDETLLGALTAGLESEEPTEEVETEEELPEGEETPEGEKAEEETPEGEEEADGEKIDEEDLDAEDAAAKAAAVAAKKPAKEADPINDPLPKGTLQSTSDRFKVVVGKLKEETTRADTATANYDEIIGEITGAGMNADSYGIMLEYARGVNSGDPVAMRKSYDILMHELKGLATALGEPLPGTNPLEGHADLIAAVNEKKIDPALAIETAVNRNRAAAQTKLQAANATRTQTQQQQTHAQAQGRAALTTLGKQLAATDGVAEYRRKAGIVVAMLQQTLPNLPPNKWASAFKFAYDKVPAAAAPAAKAGAGKVPGAKKPQPLRGNKVPSGGNTKQPKSLMEAIGPAFE